MKFLDSFKLACHNLWNNKSRTLLTVFIVFIVSLLIMLLSTLGITIISNQNRMMTEGIRDLGTRLAINTSPDIMSKETYEDAYRIFEENDVLVQRMTARVEGFRNQDNTVGASFWMQASDGNISYVYADFRFPLSASADYMLEGRIWSGADSGTNGVWVSGDYIQTLQKMLGKTVKVGDMIEFDMCYVEYVNGAPQNQQKQKLPFEVRGVFTEEKLPSVQWQGETQVYFDLAYMLDKMPQGKVGIAQLESFYMPIETFSYNQKYFEFKEFQTQLKEVFPDVKTDYGMQSQVISEIVFMGQSMLVMTLVLVGVIVLLGLIILLISIGSVANTIIISVDKNKKFIGLLKAMGLKHNGVKKIVRTESFLTVLFGVLLSTAALFLMQPILLTLVKTMFSGMFGYYSTAFTVTVTIPFYLPVIVFAAFVLFANLFSRGSLSSMGKMDVISIISEVA